MVNKFIFVAVIVGMAFIIGILACFGWIYGHAWWRRRERYGKP